MVERIFSDKLILSLIVLYQNKTTIGKQTNASLHFLIFCFTALETSLYPITTNTHAVVYARSRARLVGFRSI